jgi:ABC-type Fe3+-hydroxamate transport system substrate-binding protein
MKKLLFIVFLGVAMIGTTACTSNKDVNTSAKCSSSSKCQSNKKCAGDTTKKVAKKCAASGKCGK